MNFGVKRLRAGDFCPSTVPSVSLCHSQVVRSLSRHITTSNIPKAAGLIPRRLVRSADLGTRPKRKTPYKRGSVAGLTGVLPDRPCVWLQVRVPALQLLEVQYI